MSVLGRYVTYPGVKVDFGELECLSMRLIVVPTSVPCILSESAVELLKAAHGFFLPVTGCLTKKDVAGYSIV